MLDYDVDLGVYFIYIREKNKFKYFVNNEIIEIVCGVFNIILMNFYVCS